MFVEIIFTIIITTVIAGSALAIYKGRRAWIKALEKSEMKREMRLIENDEAITERRAELAKLEVANDTAKKAWTELNQKVAAAVYDTSTTADAANDPVPCCPSDNRIDNNLTTLNIRPALVRITQSYIDAVVELQTTITKQREQLMRLERRSAVYVENYMPDLPEKVALPDAKLLVLELDIAGWVSPDMMDLVKELLKKTE